MTDHRVYFISSKTVAKELQNGICFALVEEEDLWLANQLKVSVLRHADSDVFVVPSFALFP